MADSSLYNDTSHLGNSCSSVNYQTTFLYHIYFKKQVKLPAEINLQYALDLLYYLIMNS